MTSIVLDPNKLEKGTDWKVVFSYDDLLSLPVYPESPLIEIINGELYVVPSPIPNHQRISRNLELLLIEFFHKNEIGEVLDAPIDVLLSVKDVVIPDLIVVSNENKNIIKDKNVQGIPDLVIEILSSNKDHDLIKKKNLYEQYHVPEYWIINPVEQSIEIYYFTNPDSKTYSKTNKYYINDTISSIQFKDLSIKLKSVFP